MTAFGGGGSIALAPEADLLGVMQALSFARSLDEVMAVARTGARRLAGADGITFVLRDGELCHYADEDAISPLWKGQRFPLTACISGWAMLNRCPAVIEDIYADPRIPHEAYRPTFVKSLVMVPVRREDPIAAIGAYWAERRRPTEDEVTVLETIANASALAIANADLFQRLQHSAAEAGRRADELAAAKAELEKANERKSRFLASCSHDLRQPFQAMRLFHAILAQTPGLPTAAVDKMGEALSQGEVLLHSLVDVSTIDTGIVHAMFEPVALAEILSGLRATFEDLAVSQGLTLQVVCGEAKVVSDPALLGRILGNLVGNAIKFTARGGVLVRTRRRAGGVAVQVWDSGPGIPQTLREEIFEDFFQVDNPERDRRRGIGLGLGIVRRLAALLGHRVVLRSRPGRGSLFSVEIGAPE